MRHFKLIPYYLIAISIYAMLLPTAQAQSAAQPIEISAVYACKDLADPMKRLECYDNAVGRLQAAEESGEVVTVSKTEVEKVERDAFGFNIPSLPKLGKLFGGKKSAETEDITNKDPKERRKKSKNGGFEGPDMDKVTLELRKVAKFGYDKKRFYFTNGQVWEQVNGGSFRVIKSKDAPTTAVISKAALGSFTLRINDSGKSLRVRRVR